MIHDRSLPSLIDLARQRLNWLKPPYATLKRWRNDLHSWRNVQRGGEITRVNVGCGKDIRDGWWNIDYVRFPGVQEIRDVTRPWRHRNLQYVFAEHFLEHLTLHQGIEFLRRAGNALASGGVIRVSTPNLTHVLMMNYRLAAEPGSPQRLHDTIATNGCFHGYGHKFLYSEEFLIHVLLEMGFAKAHAFDFGASDNPDLRDMERHGAMEIDHGVRSVATIEATKGTRVIAPSAQLKALLDRYYDGEDFR
jgi:predicted SAM-dependent methyltransferase